VFCNRCGYQLKPEPAACPGCGLRLGDPTAVIAQERLKHHMHTLALLWMAVGGLFLIPAVVLMVFGGGIHVLLHRQEPLAELLPIFVYLAGASFLVLGAGGISLGLGLKQRRPWARTLAIILSVLALFHPPIGTALGIYTSGFCSPTKEATNTDTPPAHLCRVPNKCCTTGPHDFQNIRRECR
jgi:hypothetical protein